MTIMEWQQRMRILIDKFPEDCSITDLEAMVRKAELLKCEKVRVRNDLVVGKIYGGIEWDDIKKGDIPNIGTVIHKYKNNTGELIGVMVQGASGNHLLSLEMLEEER